MTSSPLSWQEFFRLRQQRRRVNLGFSIGTGLVSLVGGAGYFGDKEVEVAQQMFGIDMIFVYGAATAACGFAGWLAGPALGTAMWKLRLGSAKVKAMGELETIFLQHVKKNRVDPSRQSFNNPVPDYYGEKVSSLKGYRQWLRNQNVYRRKSTFS